MTNLATTPPPILVAYDGLQKRGAYLRDNTVFEFCIGTNENLKAFGYFALVMDTLAAVSKQLLL